MISNRIFLRVMTSLALMSFVITLDAYAFAQDFEVIVHKSNPIKSFSKEELREIYLGNQLFWDGSSKRITPARLDEESNVTEDFLTTIVGKETSMYISYWRRRLFSGRGIPPKKFEDSVELIEFVSKYKNSIGFVPKGKGRTNNKVRVISIK